MSTLNLPARRSPRPLRLCAEHKPGHRRGAGNRSSPELESGGGEGDGRGDFRAPPGISRLTWKPPRE
ncbi:MAG TPA: hypothetical protein VGC89_04525 [Pyrinomonadaceae bacterium]